MAGTNNVKRARAGFADENRTVVDPVGAVADRDHASRAGGFADLAEESGWIDDGKCAIAERQRARFTASHADDKAVDTGKSRERQRRRTQVPSDIVAMNERAFDGQRAAQRGGVRRPRAAGD